jgi:hypothetical protein
LSLAALLVAAALAGDPGIGNVALMSFAMDAPYGLQQVQGRRPDGSVVMTGNGTWFRAGYGTRNSALDSGQPVQPPKLSGYVQTAKEALVVDGHPAQVTVGSAKLGDGSTVVYFSAEVTGATVAPFIMEAVVPDANAPAWVAELKRTLASVELFEE